MPALLPPRPPRPPLPALPGPAQRELFLDWLRIAAFGLLMLYHVGMYYVSWGWHVKSPFASTALEPLMLLSNPWRMGLLFLVSGAATAALLRSGRFSLRERATRLLLPLALGVAVIVPPQAYQEVVHKLGYAGGYGEFLALYFRAHTGFCEAPGRCLVLPTWNHLWYLPYLFVYTTLLAGLLALWPRLLEHGAALALRQLQGWKLFVLPIALLAAARLGLLTRFGVTHALVDDAYQHAVFIPLFLFGAVAMRAPALFERMAAVRHAALGAALLAWLLLLAYFRLAELHGPWPEWLRALQRVVWACMQWCALVAVLGYGRRHLQREHRWRRPLNEAVFPVYLVHQTVIIGLAVALRPWGLPPALEAPLLVAATLAAGLLAWRLARRAGPLRPWLGLAAPRRRAAQQPQGAAAGG